MNTVLENEILKIEVSDAGAQLMSVYDKRTDTEHLWQGDPAFWKDRAPNLFPYIARLTDGKYTYKGTEYAMKIHGFAKYRTLKLISSGNELCYELTDDEETRAQYPFSFSYRVRYALSGDTVKIAYEVDNRGDETMYFAVGGHPGFNIPVDGKGAFTDYGITFPKLSGTPAHITFSDDCFVIGEEPYDGLADGRLALRHDLFDHDAVVLRDSGRSVCIDAPMAETRIHVEMPDMAYVGFWHAVKKEAPYVCVEPWSSLPSRKGVVEDIEKQENLNALAPGKTYTNRWEIRIEKK